MTAPTRMRCWPDMARLFPVVYPGRWRYRLLLYTLRALRPIDRTSKVPLNGAQLALKRLFP